MKADISQFEALQNGANQQQSTMGVFNATFDEMMDERQRELDSSGNRGIVVRRLAQVVEALESVGGSLETAMHDPADRDLYSGVLSDVKRATTAALRAYQKVR